MYVGRITIWSVPVEGLDYAPIKTWQPHKESINCLANTWKHVVSISDDGSLMVHDMFTFTRIRKIIISDWCVDRNLFSHGIDIPRRLKSLSLRDYYRNGDRINDPGSEDGSLGIMTVGTSYGEIIVMSLGPCV